MFGDIKLIIRSCKSNDRQHNGKKKQRQHEQQQSTKKIHRKRNIEQHEHHKIGGKVRMNKQFLLHYRRVTLATNPVISHACGKDWIVITDKRNITVVICDNDIP